MKKYRIIEERLQITKQGKTFPTSIEDFYYSQTDFYPYVIKEFSNKKEAEKYWKEKGFNIPTELSFVSYISSYYEGYVYTLEKVEFDTEGEEVQWTTLEQTFPEYPEREEDN